MFSCCNLITSYQFIVYIAVRHVYFRRQKFSFQTHMIRHQNWHQKMESIYGAGLWSVCHRPNVVDLLSFSALQTSTVGLVSRTTYR